jgi:hypothetical protein
LPAKAKDEGFIQISMFFRKLRSPGKGSMQKRLFKLPGGWRSKIEASFPEVVTRIFTSSESG